MHDISENFVIAIVKKQRLKIALLQIIQKTYVHAVDDFYVQPQRCIKEHLFGAPCDPDTPPLTIIDRRSLPDIERAAVLIERKADNARLEGGDLLAGMLTGHAAKSCQAAVNPGYIEVRGGGHLCQEIDTIGQSIFHPEFKMINIGLFQLFGLANNCVDILLNRRKLADDAH